MKFVSSKKKKKYRLRGWIKILLFGVLIWFVIAKIENISFARRGNTTKDSSEKRKEEVVMGKGSLISEDKIGNDKPLVYIYNTHQQEEYKGGFVGDYHINPNVTYVSYILKEKLSDLGINALVEEKEIKKVLNDNRWKYGYSYKVSRMFLEDAFNNNESLVMFIDIHRDSGSHDHTTLNYNGKSYAKLLFVVGLENQNYEKNLSNAGILNNILNKNVNNISRGILKKQGKGVNGVYNQDFSAQSFLIEVGGEYNSLEEAKNSIEVIAKSIEEYLGDYIAKEKS